MLNASSMHGFPGEPPRSIDTTSARLWLEEGFSVADVLTILEIRHRFELSARDGRTYAVEILWAVQEEMRTGKDSSIHPRKETHHAVA